MKNLLPALLVLVLVFASCKKERSPASNPTTATGTTVTSIMPSNGSAGTLVTVFGTNFGTSTTGVTVSFNGVSGSVQSVTATEIKAVATVTTSGTVTVTVGGQTVTGPTFTYGLPITITSMWRCKISFPGSSRHNAYHALVLVEALYI